MKNYMYNEIMTSINKKYRTKQEKKIKISKMIWTNYMKKMKCHISILTNIKKKNNI